MALHPRQQFRGRARLLIREAVKDIIAIENHDGRDPTNKILTAAALAAATTLLGALNAALLATINR